MMVTKLINIMKSQRLFHECCTEISMSHEIVHIQRDLHVWYFPLKMIKGITSHLSVCHTDEDKTLLNLENCCDPLPINVGHSILTDINSIFDENYKSLYKYMYTGKLHKQSRATCIIRIYILIFYVQFVFYVCSLHWVCLIHMGVICK